MRHWDQLAKLTGKTFDFDGDKPKFTFQSLCDMGLADFIEAIEEVSTRATKEFGIAKDLDKIISDWAPVEFEFNIMKNTKDVLLIKNFEECVGLTDEHLGSITNLNFSPYKAEFEEQITVLYDGMGIVAEVMEIWIKLQVS